MVLTKVARQMIGTQLGFRRPGEVPLCAQSLARQHQAGAD
jgi:hypothetical protein